MLRIRCRSVVIASLCLLAVLGLAGCLLVAPPGDIPGTGSVTVDLPEDDAPVIADIPEGRSVTLNISSDGSIQLLKVGDLLIVQLEGNASTGYEWARVEPTSLEGSPVDIVGEGDYQTVGTPMPGAPGEFEFRYRAMRPGTVTLQFEHRRPWETGDPIDSYSVTIWVQ